jgi:hypothetical protein
MKDQRLKVFRGAIDGLLESLDAFVRVSRWTEPGDPPEPLKSAAAKLVDRLGTAHRLSSGTFVGTPADTSKVTAMCGAMKRLDAAYVVYRQQLEWSPDQGNTAAGTLEAEIGEVRTGADEWR